MAKRFTPSIKVFLLVEGANCQVTDTSTSYAADLSSNFAGKKDVAIRALNESPSYKGPPKSLKVSQSLRAGRDLAVRLKGAPLRVKGQASSVGLWAKGV